MAHLLRLPQAQAEHLINSLSKDGLLDICTLSKKQRTKPVKKFRGSDMLTGGGSVKADELHRVFHKMVRSGLPHQAKRKSFSVAKSH